MATIVNNMTTEQAKLQQAISGLSVFPGTSQLNFAGATWNDASITKVFQAALDAMATVQKDRATLSTDLAAQNAARAAANVLYVQLKDYVQATFGKGAAQLSAFGFKSGVRSTPTATTKALAAAKAKQTRQARGTLGSKQKAKVTVAGSPGLQLVSPTGQPIPDATQGPVAPAVGSTPSAGTGGSSK